MMETLDEIIERQLCPEAQRMNFLTEHVGRRFFEYEAGVYDTMSRYCHGYNGGYWSYYTLSNNGFYICLNDENRRFRVTCESNHYDGEMSAEAACIGVNLFVLCQLSAHDEGFVDKFYALREFAIQHSEAAAIMAFID